MIRKAKRDGRLPFSNNRLRMALDMLINKGIIQKQEDESFRLVEDYEERKEHYLKLLIEE